MITEWSRLIRAYAARQGKELDDAVLAPALKWSEPSRDVSTARQQAIALMEQQPLRCVWTDIKLTQDTLDIDHCLPWVAWPCGDLWNLMPTHRRVNQHQKRDRLPTEGILKQAQGRIQTWWNQAYLQSANPILPERFTIEARASLPIISIEQNNKIQRESIFEGLTIQRLRLKNDQQIAEWPS